MKKVIEEKSNKNNQKGMKNRNKSEKSKIKMKLFNVYKKIDTRRIGCCLIIEDNEKNKI